MFKLLFIKREKSIYYFIVSICIEVEYGWVRVKNVYTM